MKTTVELTMKDINSGKKVNRSIDISNIITFSGYIGTTGQQENLLKDWIKERGNEQHNTKLELISWYIK